MKKMNKKVLFLIPVHSVVDTITNSSSELFVGINNSKEDLERAIEIVYPDYLTEYESLMSIDDLSPEELDMYFNYACSAYHWPAKKEEYPVLPGFTFDELYEKREKAWSGDIQYKLRNNNKNVEHVWDYAFVTEENFEEIKNKLDPNRQMFFLYSLNENPDWEKQELLESFMIRYHLG